MRAGDDAVSELYRRMFTFRCDCCGRFLWPTSPGVSWCQTYTHLDLNDPTYRCSTCTDRHGVKPTNCNPLSGPYNGRNPLPDEAARV